MFSVNAHNTVIKKASVVSYISEILHECSKSPLFCPFDFCVETNQCWSSDCTISTLSKPLLTSKTRDYHHCHKTCRDTQMSVIMSSKCHYSFYQSLWCISQIRIEILKTTCSIFTSSSSSLVNNRKAVSHFSLRRLSYVHISTFVFLFSL